jgi:hypothetical protein
MRTLPAAAARRQPRPAQPTPHGAATSRTVHGGAVVPAPHGWAWVKRPEWLPDGRPGWHDALLLIDGTVYDAEAAFITDGDSGHHRLIVDLRQPDSTHYRLVLGPQDACDCPHATYRSLTCKHVACVRAALDWLDEAERREWSEALDRAPDPAGGPF